MGEKLVKYRLYIDEVGNSDIGSSNDPNHRYLSLTGIIIDNEHHTEIASPAIEALKHTYFTYNPDKPVILHRKELMNKNHPFEVLRDPAIASAFDRDLLLLLKSLDYSVITVIIDKQEHKKRYQRWLFDPYHYCLTVMVERYVLWLQTKNAVGDVLAESRGKQDDRRLKDSFERVYVKGSDFVNPQIFSSYLTSKQLKLQKKRDNIAGLQLADIIAHPSFRGTLARREHRSLPDAFGGKIETILENSKYVRSHRGQIDGYGRKWLP